MTLIAVGWVMILGPSRVRTALPWDASEILEFHQENGFLPDYVYLLRARIRAEDFEPLATRLGLDQRFSNAPIAMISWPDDCKEEWWNPPKQLDNARYRYNDGEEVFVVAA